MTIAATLGTREPLRGQLRIALNNGVTKDEIKPARLALEVRRAAVGAEVAVPAILSVPGATLRVLDTLSNISDTN